MNFLFDEMYPPMAAEHLRAAGHEASHVDDLGLSGAQDYEVATAAREQGAALVTENVADFAHEHDLVLVCVLKRNLRHGGQQAASLAELLGRWAGEHPRPYLGQHWPR